MSSKVPAPIVKQLRDALAVAQKNPSYLESLAKQGANAGDPGPEAYHTLIVNDVKSGADGKGAVALWIGPGTVAHFRNLTVEPPSVK